jgi:hypothetical protein
MLFLGSINKLATSVKFLPAQDQTWPVTGYNTGWSKALLKQLCWAIQGRAAKLSPE